MELADGSVIEAGKVVLATGTDAAVPPIPGIEDGPYWTNREAIWKPDAPPRSLAVIGTGAVGIEFAQIYARFGSRVTALEALPHVLPQEDEEAAASILPALEADGIAVRPGVRIERAEPRRDRLDAHARGGRAGARRRAPGGDGSPSDVRAPRPRAPPASSSIGKGTPS